MSTPLSGAEPSAPAAPPAPSGPADPPNQPWSRKRKVLLTIGVVFAVLLAGGAAFGVYAYRHLNENLSTIPDIQYQGDRPVAIQPSQAAAEAPMNILLIGSDTREGDNGFVGGAKGAGLSDTTILLHVSGDRTRALAVSIPRDSMVDMPSCRTTSGGTSGAGLRQFNEAYSLGGASCVRRTVEQLTDVRIDHYVVVDFAGFRDMVGALGGVKVDLPQAIDDNDHNIHLAAGCQTLSGDAALSYVRVRYRIGNGTDTDRIQRQQAFLSSVIQKVTSRGTLTNPVKLYSFLDAATKATSTDNDLNTVAKLASLAQDLRQVGLDRITFVTIPTEQYPADHNRLQWTSDAPRVWKAIRLDKPLKGVEKAEEGTPTPTQTGAPLVAAPSTINVRVLNATGTKGAAKDAASELTALGYHVVGYDTAPSVRSTTIVRWSAPRNESARTVASATGGTDKQVGGLGQVVELVIGTDYAGAHQVTVSSGTTPTPDISARTADEPICQ